MCLGGFPQGWGGSAAVDAPIWGCRPCQYEGSAVVRDRYNHFQEGMCTSSVNWFAVPASIS